MAAVTGSVAISSPALAQTPCTAADLISAISAANSANGTVTLTSGCTYTLTGSNNTTDGGDNSSPYGANILNSTGFTLTIGMSIVAYGQGGGPNCGGSQAVTDAGYNLDTGSTCGFSTASHSMSNTDPQFDPLASNGGPTQTMALPPSGSPAVDSIPASTPGCSGTTDQRGVVRPQAQDARATFSSATDWYAVAAVFRHA